MHNGSLRKLGSISSAKDFSSNDYLGLASSEEIFTATEKILEEFHLKRSGATGSRLLTGNHLLYPYTEDLISRFHNCEAALIFNSGYDANIGLFSSVPQRADVILYDEYVHASIREGILLSKAKSLKFRHNDVGDLQKKIMRNRDKNSSGEIFIVTESVFSMDGDSPDLKGISELAEELKCFLIIDEAHSTGIFGKRGEGLLQELELQKKVFARIITFGKALGCHGAAVLGTDQLKQYLLNFARSLIYTTALPPHSLAAILAAYQHLENSGEDNSNRKKLKENIQRFKSEISNNLLDLYFIPSISPIQCMIISGNENVKDTAQMVNSAGFDVKPILSPTVPEGKERLRICLHSFNTSEEIEALVKVLSEASFKNKSIAL